MKRLAAAVAVLLSVAGCNAYPRAGAVADTPDHQNDDKAGTAVVAPGSPMLAQIRLEPVRVAELPTDEIVAPGKIEANPNRVARVGLPVAGRITTVLIRTGDAVATNQPLLTMQSPDADAAVSTYTSAQASLAQAQVGMAKAEADLDRASDLFEHDAIAKKEVLAADNALAQAKAALEQARASREQAARRLDVLGLKAGDFAQQVVVRAPIAGKVLDLSVVPGEFKNDTNAPVMTIADLGAVWVTSQVPESAIRFIRLGEPVEISLVAYPGRTFEGRVSRIADTVDPQTRTVKVQAEMKNADGQLRPEMYGSIRHLEAVANVPVVPIGAVVQSDDHAVVYVESAPGRFEPRAVSIGRRSGEVVRVVTGLKPGERVVVDGAILLSGLAGRSAR